MKLKFFGEVIKGILKLKDQKGFLDYIKTFEGKKVEILITKFKKSRSVQQNRYYWGVVIPILCDFTGYEKEEMHEAIKLKFLYEERVVKGLKIPTVRSTTDLSTIELMDLMRRIYRWAALELSVNIPDPDGYIHIF